MTRIDELEKRIEALQNRLDVLAGRRPGPVDITCHTCPMRARIEALENGEVYTPGMEEYRRAIRALAAGDNKPLKEYLRKGGIIPKPKERKTP